ncbi:Uncharacterised protein [Mycobacteroides abscessus subsp. abscessus]|nr:Uncharacterised protein [Mycobacteroides abscessus subsp. abscessus]
MLGGYIVVIELGGQMLRRRHGGNRVTRELRIGAGVTDLRKSIGDSLRFVAYGHRIDAHGLQKRRGDAIGLAEQCHQQVSRTDFGIACCGRCLEGSGQRGLSLRGRIERVHNTSMG